MPNVYKSIAYAAPTANQIATAYTATAATTLLKNVVASHKSAAPSVSVYFVPKSGTPKLLETATLTTNRGTALLLDVIPLAAGDAIAVETTDTSTDFVLSILEAVESVAGQSINVHSDVNTTGAADGDRLTWNESTGNWEPAAPGSSSGDVTSVNGQTGVVVLDPDDLDDTSTANKWTTAADISKLAGIEAGAQVNTVTSVNGQTGVVVLDPDDLDDTSTANKWTTAADISKLAGIEAGAQVNTVTSVNGQTGVVVLDPDDLDDTSTANKWTTAADISKLAGIEAGAQVNLPISVNGEPADATGDIAVDTSLIPEGSNLYFTDARVTANATVTANTNKLAGIEAGAQVNVNADWSAITGDAEILNKPYIPEEFADLAGTTDDVNEGQGNLYFTDARADARISAASILDLNDTPSTYGTNGQVLTTNGAGGTTWATPTGGDTFPKNHALWQGFVSGVTSWPAAPGFAAWSAIAQHLEVEWDSASATNAAKEYVVPATGLYECNGFFTIVGQGSNTVKIILPVFVNGVRTLDMSRTTKSVFFNEYDGVGGTGVLPLSAGDVVTFNLYLLAISGAMPKLATDRLALHFAIRMIDA